MSKAPIHLEGFTVTGDGCPHCLTDGKRDHSKVCPTLADMTDDEKALAVMSYADKERLTQQQPATKQAATSAPAGALAQYLGAVEAIELSQEERQEALKLAGKGVKALRSYVRETDRLAQIATQAAQLLGLSPAS